eukprot:TRINITY_DN30781_c0_g1_i1.p1 TRINITY_DN30781_c0_g1~~TRINITY_DN30781_c0_g1_i1.p1  ORF type:complete len:747 (+),score=183.36 TRINITY_DN30781_c0_g1_i1:86-2242(+)
MDEQKQIEGYFSQLDKNKDGTLSPEEIKGVFGKMGGLADDELADLMRQVDTNEDGRIDIKEFSDWVFGSEETRRFVDKVLEQARQARSCTRAQLKKKDELFGPFAPFTLDGIPSPGELRSEIRRVTGETKVDVKLFTQFLHWLQMQVVGRMVVPGKGTDMLTELEANSAMFNPSGAPILRQDHAFELVGAVVDVLVPGLAPDIFKFIDHNSDGELQDAEWDALVRLITNPSPDTMNSLLFTVMDKNNSQTIEMNEAVAFCHKVIGLAVSVVSAVINVTAEAATMAWSHTTMHRAFAELDGDMDGKLTIEECTMNFHPMLLQSVMALSEAFAGMSSTMAADDTMSMKASKACFWFVQELGGFAGDVKDSFFELMKKIVLEQASMWLENGQLEVAKYASEASSGSVVKSCMESAESVVAALKDGKCDAKLRGFSDALFVLLDTDCDGKVSQTDVKLWTQFVAESCSSEDDAKARLQSLFNALDCKKAGLLEKDDLLAFLGKLGIVAKNLILLAVDLIGDFVAKISEVVLKTAAEFYLSPGVREKYAGAQSSFKSFDRDEMNRFLRSAPAWGRALVEKQLFGLESLGSDRVQDFAETNKDDLESFYSAYEDWNTQKKTCEAMQKKLNFDDFTNEPPETKTELEGDMQAADQSRANSEEVMNKKAEPILKALEELFLDEASPLTKIEAIRFTEEFGEKAAMMSILNKNVQLMKKLSEAFSSS